MSTKPRLVYIVATNLDHFGLAHKFKGQVHAFQSHFQVTFHYFNYKKTDASWKKIAKYLLFECKSIYYLLSHRHIYIRYDPKAIVSNLVCGLVAHRKRIIMEHNSIFDYSLAVLHRHVELKLHKATLQFLKKKHIYHTCVSKDIIAFLVEKGVPASQLMYLQNGFLPVENRPECEDVHSIQRAQSFAKQYKKVGVFVGNGYAWHGLEKIIQLIHTKSEVGLIIIGNITITDQEKDESPQCLFLGEQNLHTITHLYRFCDFGLGGFKNDINNRKQISHLKVVEYLCNGLTVLVNNDECAYDFDALKPFIFNYHVSESQFDDLLHTEINKADVIKISSATLSWNNTLSDSVQLFLSTP